MNSRHRDFAFLQSGSGELFQAFRGDEALSSVLVLRSPEGAYYQSAGTSSEGMGFGASHFLIYCVASQLKSDGLHSFNLGGADKQTGLSRFKAGFGASRVHLESASVYIGPLWRRKASRAIELLRNNHQKLAQIFPGSLR
jgi:lipid II:glycine glycyltransferase (peptidoglycan interpeptide bridge formation enzyme)